MAVWQETRFPMVSITIFLIRPRGASKTGLEQFLELISRQTLGFVLFVLDKVVTETIVVLVDDHSPNDKNVGPSENGSGALFIVFNVLFVQFLVARPVNTSVLF